ncbi:acyltransferase family protein [Candidatus Saccharibacteria bacterium]|nr:acyltransferase family protein [Candidatus Saccharibacteria bacterium]
MEAKKDRSPTLDIIRIFATFCVIAVHFFLNCGLYNRPVQGEWMLLAITVRSFFMICIPLFLMLSGYLLSDKITFNKKYLKRILPIIATYLIAGLACWIYRWCWKNEAFSLSGTLLSIFNYGASPYGWYIEMYIGLFLLIPFLNIFYKSLKTIKRQRMLLLVLFTIAILPSVISVYGFNEPNWWSAATGSDSYYRFVPTWWQTPQIAFIFYYLMGCYLKQRPLKFKNYQYLLMIGGLTVLAGLYSFWRNHGENFTGGPWSDYNSIFTASLAILIFNYFLKLRYREYRKTTRAVLKYLSGLCLGTYLVSWIFDQVFYVDIQQIDGPYLHRLVYMPLLVPVIFVCSMALSAGLMLLQRGIAKLLARRA